MQQPLKLDSTDWHDQLAKLMTAHQTLQFPKVLVDTLRCVVPFDHSVFFAFHGEDSPKCLYDSFTPHQRIVMVADYQEGPFLLDPFYIACHDRTGPTLYRLRDIAPDRFYHSEYYRSYYRRTGLSEEIAFILALPNNVGLTISLMRSGTSPSFSDRDINKLRRIQAIVYTAASRHWNDLGQKNNKNTQTNKQSSSIDLHVASAFQNFGRSLLTKREREVVGMVLRGHSSESIGRHLGISTGTVKIHRKNTYAKLEISSQSELFSHFISYLSSENISDSQTAN